MATSTPAAISTKPEIFEIACIRLSPCFYAQLERAIP
jgi:hypothetical protein